jgi:hypothetical protein
MPCINTPHTKYTQIDKYKAKLSQINLCNTREEKEISACVSWGEGEGVMRVMF